jgi:hypothetical protein
MLKQAPDADRQHTSKPSHEYADAYFWVSDARALAAEFTAKGAELITQPTEQEIYNGRDFHVRDCDGRTLIFGQLLG